MGSYRGIIPFTKEERKGDTSEKARDQRRSVVLRRVDNIPDKRNGKNER